MPDFSNFNYYEVLGVDRDATSEQIRRAYLTKVKEVHPDVSAHPDANRLTAILHDARDILLDDKNRRQYDNDLVEWERRRDRERAERERREEERRKERERAERERREEKRRKGREREEEWRKERERAEREEEQRPEEKKERRWREGSPRNTTVSFILTLFISTLIASPVFAFGIAIATWATSPPEWVEIAIAVVAIIFGLIGLGIAGLWGAIAAIIVSVIILVIITFVPPVGTPLMIGIGICLAWLTVKLLQPIMPSIVAAVADYLEEMTQIGRSLKRRIVGGTNWIAHAKPKFVPSAFWAILISGLISSPLLLLGIGGVIWWESPPGWTISAITLVLAVSAFFVLLFNSTTRGAAIGIISIFILAGLLLWGTVRIPYMGIASIVLGGLAMIKMMIYTYSSAIGKEGEAE